jgi:PKD repeat protein
VGDDGPRDRLSASDELIVTVAPVANIPPVAAADGPAAARTAEILRFDGTASHDPDGNILEYRWDFGDGGASHEASPLHTFHDAGTYRVRLTVMDDGTVPMTAEAAIEITITADVAGGSAP